MQRVTQQAELFPGVAELLSELRAAGIKLALVADGRTESFKNVLGQHELRELFDAVTTSEDIGATKPDPRVFEVAMAELGIEQNDYGRVVMVGNRLDRDVKGANNVGMISIWFRGGAGTYPDQPSAADETPTYTATTMAEVRRIVLALHTGEGQGDMVDTSSAVAEVNTPKSSVRTALARRVLFRPASLCILAVGAVLVLSDWGWGFLHGFWIEHQVVTSVVTSLLFVMIAIVLIDAWAKERDLAQWRRVANLAYKALIESVRESRDGLIMLAHGDYPYRPLKPEMNQRREVVRPIVAQYQTQSLSRQLLLDRLMRESAWVEEAFAGISAMYREGRLVLGHWAPLMLESLRLAQAFSRVALITDALEDLQRPLHPIHRDRGQISDSRRRAVAAELWDEVITTAIKLEEDLANEMGRVGWRTRARQLLSEEGAARIAERDQGDPFAASDDRLNALRDRIRDQYQSSWDVVSEQRSAEPQA